jgi:hypothetical protein
MLEVHPNLLKEKVMKIKQSLKQLQLRKTPKMLKP